MEENTVTIRGITFSKDELTIITLDKLKVINFVLAIFIIFQR